MIKTSDKIVLFSALLSLIVFTFWMIPNVSASLGTFKQGECIQLLGTSETSSMNISSITYPSNGTTIFETFEMTKNDRTFNYTFCDTNQLGMYSYLAYDSLGNVWVNDFVITPSGGDKLTSAQGLAFAGGLIIIIALGVLCFWWGKSTEKLVLKALLISLGMIIALVGILYTLLILNEVVATSPTLVEGFETFYFVFKMILWIGFLCLLFLSAWVLWKAWKIKRGLE